MGINKFALLAGLVLTAILFSEVVTHADEANQSTKITFSAPSEIPGQTLPAGTYRIKLMDPDEPDVVQIFNSDGTGLYATLPTIRTERREPTGDSVLVMAEQGAARPDAVLKWFYPGDTSGHEFVYSNQEKQQLAQDRQQRIAAKDTAEAGD